MISGPDGAAQSARPPSIFLEGRLPLVTPAFARELGLREGETLLVSPRKARVFLQPQAA